MLNQLHWLFGILFDLGKSRPYTSDAIQYHYVIKPNYMELSPSPEANCRSASQ
jgi:hypothetical protein